MKADVVSYAAIIPSDEAAWQAACTCADEMRQGHTAGNIRLWNSCMRSASLAGRWSEVFESMAELKVQSLESDSISYTMALSAVEEGQVWRQALMTSQLQNLAVSVDQLACSSVSRAHAMSNLWQESMSLLRRHGKEIRLDVVMQNEILDAYEKSAEWRSTLSLASTMSLAGLEQDPVSFCAVMSSCQTSDSWPWMTGILEHLRKSHQPLDLTCHFPADTAM